VLDPTTSLSPGWPPDTLSVTRDELNDIESCRQLLTYFFRLLDSGQYSSLKNLVSPDFSQRHYPDGPALSNLKDAIANTRNRLGDDWYYRTHINHSLLFERVSANIMIGTAVCFHYILESTQDQVPSLTITNARYTFDRSDDGIWRLSRREHYVV